MAWKRIEIAWKQGNEMEPVAACAVIGFLLGLQTGIYIILYIILVGLKYVSHYYSEKGTYGYSDK